MKRALKDLFTTNFIKAVARTIGLSGLIIGAATMSAVAQKKYDTGATDTEIKIGNIMPYSGPASAYGIIGKAMSAYFRMINDNGGVNGRKINFISYDDAYSAEDGGAGAQAGRERRGVFDFRAARHRE
jgi:ABC-type branched-subunit amino acid transport system substrate-binding protein